MTSKPMDISELRSCSKILDRLNQGVAIFDKNKKLLYVNEAVKAVTGGRDLIGASLDDIARKYQLRLESGELVKLYEFPIMAAFQGIETRDKVYEYISSAGNHIWLSITSERVLDEKGELECVFTMISSVTDYKLERDRLEFLIKSIKTLSLTADPLERIGGEARLVVPALADWCAIDILTSDGEIKRVVVAHRDPRRAEKVKEFEEKFPSDPLSPANPATIIRSGRAHFIPLITNEMIDESSRSPEHAKAVKELQLKSLMAIPIVAHQKTLGCMTLGHAESGRIFTEADFEFFKEFCGHLGVLLDNERLYTEITRRDKAKDIFLASLSHELRNPLAPIKTSLELLHLKGIPANLEADIATIEHQFDHMSRLLNDLLDATRYTQAKITLSKSTVDLKRVLGRVIEASKPVADAASVIIGYSSSPGPIYVEADPTRLEQAIINLVSNAIKFTRSGGRVQVEIAESGDTASIVVRDNGVGIDPKDLPNVFEMYYQGWPETGRMSSGLGIGLYLVQQIITLHGGTVTAKSDGVGLGSEFTIRLPVSQSAAIYEGGDAEHTMSLAGRRILVVDDNTAAADSLVRLLNALGARAEALHDGRDVLARPDLDAFDSIVLDIGMSGLNGYEVARGLRERGFVKPVIALTGYGLREDHDKALRGGFSAHLVKPMDLAELRAVLEQSS